MERGCIISLSIIDTLMLIMLVLFNASIVSNIYVLIVYTLIMVLISGYIVYLSVSMTCEESINQFDKLDR